MEEYLKMIEDMQTMAVATKTMFDAFVAAGFNEDQAMKMVGLVIASALGAATGN